MIACRSNEFIKAQLRKTELRKIDIAIETSKLIFAVEKVVIPKLVAAHKKDAEDSRQTIDADSFEEAQIIAFVRLLLGPEAGNRPSVFITSLRADGVSVERICLNLLAPAARHLGAMWDDDRCTFVAVTLGLGSLHRILLSLCVESRLSHRRNDVLKRVLLVQSTDSHNFGLQMVAEFFKRAAWSVDVADSATDDVLGDTVRNDWFTAVGFSSACEASLGHLTNTIRTVRDMSLNRQISILVGGAAFIGHPEFVGRVGADALGVDAVQAVFEAECLTLKQLSFSL